MDMTLRLRVIRQPDDMLRCLMHDGISFRYSCDGIAEQRLFVLMTQ